MMCPKCGALDSRVVETRPRIEGWLRYRTCKKCAHRFSTMERVCTSAPGRPGYLDHVVGSLGGVVVQLAPDPEPAKPNAKPVKQQRVARFTPESVPEDFGITGKAVPLLLQWWNESRRSKHGSKATWTEAAWLSSVRRVGALPADRQVQLCAAGVENGWMALKEEFMGDHKPLGLPRMGRRPIPKDLAMLAALEEL